VPFPRGALRELGPRVICAHKGLSGPIADLAPAGASPRDVGPAAARFEDLTFVVYHSGFDLHDGVAGDPAQGVGRLATSLASGGASDRAATSTPRLGSTWYLVLRRPEVAAHVLGTLLLAVGEEPDPVGHRLGLVRPAAVSSSTRSTRFCIPERMQEEFGYPPLTDAAKRKILGAECRCPLRPSMNRRRVVGVTPPGPGCPRPSTSSRVRLA